MAGPMLAVVPPETARPPPHAAVPASANQASARRRCLLRTGPQGRLERRDSQGDARSVARRSAPRKVYALHDATSQTALTHSRTQPAAEAAGWKSGKPAEAGFNRNGTR